MSTINKDLANKFGVFGYSYNDINTACYHYDTKEEAKAAALELSQELNATDLFIIEVWQADESGLFGITGEPIWSREYNNESNNQ